MKTLCEYKDGCFGCCGAKYKTKKEIKADIKQNTKEFKENKLPLLKFRTRNKNKYTKGSGVCQNIIIDKGKCFCPLHPKRNNEIDLRKDYCNTEYWCKTMEKFQEWDTHTKNRFKRFLKQKDLDIYDYSIQMDNDKLLEEFLKI